MIRLGLRLTLRGGREATVRLAVTAAAVALGVTLLLITLAGINALNAQNARAAWLSTSAHNPHPGLSRGGTGRRPAVVAVQLRQLRQPGHLPGRCRRHRAQLTRPARHPAPARTRAVLRLAGPQPAPAPHPGQPARRPVPGAARSAPSDPQRSRHRTPSSSSSATPPASSRRHRAPSRSAASRPRPAAGRRPQLDGPPIHPRAGGAGTLLPPARLPRHRDPAFGSTSGAAVRRPSPHRRDAPAGLGTGSRRSLRRRPRRSGDRLHPVLPALPGRGGHSLVHRHAFRPRRPVAQSGRHPARRHRHPRSGSGGGAHRAAARADLAAWGHAGGSLRQHPVPGG